MRTDGYGGGVVLAQLGAVLILLLFLPLTLPVIVFVHVRDWLERRAEARAVAGA
jgi:hypothetical protein